MQTYAFAGGTAVVVSSILDRIAPVYAAAMCIRIRIRIMSGNAPGQLTLMTRAGQHV